MVRGSSAVLSKIGKARGSHRAATGPAAHAARPPATAALPPAAGRVRKKRRALKDLRVRSRLLLLVIIPTVTAVAAGGIFIASSVGSAVVYQRVLTLASLSGKITGLVQALQNEREDTVRFIVLGSDNGGRGAPPSSALPPGPELAVLNRDYAVTDGWANQVKALAGEVGSSYPALAQQEMQATATAIGNLPAIRAAATRTRLPALIVIGEYATAIDTALAVESQIAVGSGDSTLAGSVRVLGLVSSMKEEASQQQALLTSGLRPDLVSLGQFGPAQQSAITDAQAQQQGDLSEFDTAATAAQRQLFNNVLSGSAVVQAQAQEQQAISLASSQSPIATDPTVSDASSALSYVVSGMRSVEQQFAEAVISRSTSLHDGAITSAAVFSLAVALLLGIALAMTVIVGRSMVRPLRRLRNGALNVAGHGLPEMVSRISEPGWDGDPVEVKPIDVDSSDEIGEVARAFDQVHREAVRLAGNEAILRGNVSAMFISLSRRSVPLIDRLARMIDALEQAEDDPGRLSSLFSIDHLVTRMRRNSENLLVLAGEEPVRKWSEPVPLTDVIRAATSEIEQYGRVALSIDPDIVISGQAAADIVHLLAEIIENATVFSPKETLVHTSAQQLAGGGVLIDVTDGGIGIPPSRLSEINWRLDNPPQIDVSVSQHMGLFAASRLAARHGARIRLRAAAPKGVSALIWLPDALTSVARGSSLARLRAAGRGGSPGGPQGRKNRPPSGRPSNWFRAKRPSGRAVQDADLSVTVPGLTVPAAAVPGVTVAGVTVASAADSVTAPARDLAAASAGNVPTTTPTTSPSSGLPLRTPGANMLSGADSGRTADSTAAGTDPAAGWPAGNSAARQVTPPRPTLPRRSPELARSRLSGFQLGSREAENQAPGPEEGASR